MARNIILTTIDNAYDILHMGYYVKKEKNDDELSSNVYCHSMVNGEAIVKYILSKYKIDEVIVLGSKASYNPEDELKSIEIRKSTEFITVSQDELSTYSLFRYRLEQYIDMLDFTRSDLLEYLSTESMNQLADAVNKYTRQRIADGKRPSRLFNDIVESDELWTKVLKDISAILDVEALSYAQVAAIKHLLYSCMSDKNKMEINEENENVEISFIPLGEFGDSQEKGLFDSFNKIWVNNGEDVNVYVGIQDANATDSSILMKLLNVLKELGEINIKKVFSTKQNANGFGCYISDDTEHYNYTNLLDGVVAFVSSGKVDKIMDTLDTIGHYDELTHDIVYAMRNIDASISLCDIDKMVSGLDKLKNLINQKWNSTALIPSLFKTVLKKGYGSLLKGDSIDIFELIKWTYSKKMYQQTLTIIESKIPADMFDRGLYYFCNSQDSKEEVITKLAECYNSLNKHETYKMKHLPHYFVKFYGRAEARSGSAKDSKHQALNFAKYKIGQIQTIGKETVEDNKCNEDSIAAHTLSNNLQALEDALFAYYYIGNVRNMTNHADTGESNDIELFPDITEDIQKMKIVSESIEFFIQKYEIAIESLKANIPEGETAASVNGGPVTIQSHEVRSLARKLFEEKNKQKEQ